MMADGNLAIQPPVVSEVTNYPVSNAIPNGEILNWVCRVLNANKNGRMVENSMKNRHEKVEKKHFKDTLTFTRKNEAEGTETTIIIKQANKFLDRKNKTFIKLLIFSLQKMTAQHFPRNIGFELRELVGLGMYSDLKNARRAVKEFFCEQAEIILSGIVKKGKKIIKESGCFLFCKYDIFNNYVTLTLSEDLNVEFLANYFTVFPRFAYALKNGTAFSLIRYIFFRARQNDREIKNKGTFMMSLESIRENLGLPAPIEVKNRKYKQFIISPIKKAVEDIKTAFLNEVEVPENELTVKICAQETGNINKWLDGYLEVGLSGDFAETFINIATKAEEENAQWKAAKQAELAKIAARQELKGDSKS